MELTLTGASLSSDVAPSSKLSNANSTNANSTNTKDCCNEHSDSNMKVKATQSTQSATQAQSQAQCQSKSESHSHSHTHSHSGNNGACCAHNHQAPTQNFSRFHNVPIERLLANPSGLFGAFIECIKNGPFDTFQYLADAVLEHEMTTGVPLAWGTTIVEDGVEVTDDVNTVTDGTVAVAGVAKKAATQESSLLHRTPEGHTLAHWASKRGNDIRFIEYLSKIPNASLQIQSSDAVGMYPIHWAATEGSIPIIAFILKHSNSNSGYATTTSSSVLHHHHHSQQQQHNNNINTQNNAPPIDPNDPINARDNSNCTPLLIAAQYGHADLSAFLIKRGADPNAVDNSSDTALHWAAYKGAVPVCGLLLHLNGIENHLDLVDAFGQTPIHLASLRGNVDVVQYLMDQAEGWVDRKMHGMDDGLGVPGNTNTNSVSSSYNTTIDKFPQKLLQTPDKDGKTPLDLALKKKKIACEVVLREYMDKHCNPDRSLYGKIKQNVKPFCSPTNWKTWLGIAPDHGHVKHSPRFVFWFVLFNVLLAVFVEFFIYAPLSFHVGFSGRLSDSSYVPLHLMTMFFLLSTFASLLLVNRTDPGRLAVTGFSASNTAASSSCPTVGSGRLCPSLFGNSIGGILGNVVHMMSGLYTNLSSREHSIICANGNGHIRREMEQLTRELQNQYEETLENFATEDEFAKDSPPATPPSLCHSCHIAKPLRSKHCRVLNQCVLLFDHHCPFVGTTIGLYNYRYFYLFVFCMSVAEFFFGITGILYLRHPKVLGGGIEFRMIFLAIYLALFGFLSVGLCLYHTQLIHLNLTTNEHANMHRLKYLSCDPATGKVNNPFDKGFIKNFIGRFKPWKGSYMLAFCNVTPSREMESSEKKNSLKKDEDEVKDLMLNVV